MGYKLYKSDVKVGELDQPKVYAGTMSPPKWHSSSVYASLDEEYVKLLIKLNPDANIVKGDADSVKAVQAILKPHTDSQKRRKIREKYSVEEELKALRTEDKTVKDDIASIIKAVDTERDALLDVS